MEKPDVEALLKQNSNIDLEALKRYLEELSRTISTPRRRGSTSPYSGRRLTPTDKTDWVNVRKVLRSHYPAI
jgi:hypothetical protein